MTTRPERPASAEWLAQRQTADIAAREAALPSLTRLADWVSHASREPDLVDAVDLGAGTGANRAYLQPRLPFPTRWTILDHDPVLLGHPRHGDARRVLGGIERVADLVEPSPTPSLLTCSALLDLLTDPQLRTLAQAMADGGAAGLFSLSVTGDVVLAPSHPDDQLLRQAFDAHQQRDGRTGPDAPARLREHLHALGRASSAVPTPWRLTAGTHDRLLTDYLSERAQVATEQDPDLAGPARAWLSTRLGQLSDRQLSVEVGHLDLLTLPGT